MLSGGVPSLNWRQTRKTVWVHNPETGYYEQRAADNPIWACYDILHGCRRLKNIKTGEMTLKWKEGVAGIDWGTLLLFGGGLAIGGMVFSTGLSAWIGESLKAAMGGHPSEVVFLTLFAVTSLLLSELTSNTAVANLMGPIAIATAVSLGFSPVPVCVVMALCTSLAFMLPVSTPPNAIVYASGYIPITKMIKAGVILDIIGVFIITIPLVLLLVKAILGV